jgi:hypothetical protein
MYVLVSIGVWIGGAIGDTLNIKGESFREDIKIE